MSVSDQIVHDDAPELPPPDADEAQPDVRHVLLRFIPLYIALAGSLTVLGVLLRLVVFDSGIGAAEADVIGWIADNRVSFLDSAATVGSTFSDTWTVIGVMVGSVTMLLVTGHPRHAGVVLLGIAFEFASFLVVGAVIDRPRPDVETLHSVPSTPSFPSGHVAAAFVLYGSLVFVARSLSRRVPGVVWIVPFLLAFSVAASRMYEGVHYPTDVTAGFLLGVGALWCATMATGLVSLDSIPGLSGRRSAEADR